MERLQKVLAQAGIASRRAAEEIILAGRVRVDGKIVRELGTQVDPRTSRVEVDGNKIVAEKLIYIVLHKPRGVVCTLSDPEGRPTILELLKDAGARVVPVGRLDFHTSGALLCTNDGEFAQALAHPKKAVPKVYVAKVKGAVDDEALDRFSERIVIDGRPTQPAQVKRLRFEGDKTWLEITLREGRNRQVRRLGEATGFPVMRLARISHAGVTSEDLRPGQWRPLTIDELVDLKRDYGVPKKVRAPIFEPALGKGGWSDEPRTPGARRPEPKFSAARRREAKPSDARRTSVRGEPPRHEAAGVERPRFDRKRSPAGRDAAAHSSREASFQGERAQSARQSNRPWEARSRPLTESRLSRNAARPSADPASGHRGRVAPNAKRGGDQDQNRFDRKRTPSREAASGDEPARFDRKRTPSGEAASGDEPTRFDRKRAPRREAAPTPEAKPFNAAHRERKRFNAKNAEPKAFEVKRTRAAAPRSEAPFRPPGGRRANREAPFEAKSGRGPNREAPFEAKSGRGPNREAPFEAKSGRGPNREAPFEAKSGRGPNRGAPFEAKSGRGPNREAPFEAKRGRDAARSREASFDAKRGRSAGPGREAPYAAKRGRGPSR